MRAILAAALAASIATPCFAGSQNDAALAVAGLFIAEKLCGLKIPAAAVQQVILSSGLSNDELSLKAQFAAEVMLDNFKTDGGAALKFCSDMGQIVGGLR
jgi:hypothetical protein